LAAVALARLVNPSIPVVYASWARGFDMRAATVSHGGPEFGLLRIATTQMAKRYRLPAGGGGMLADSKLVDVQLGMEKLATALLPALAGTDLILGMGLTASETAFSPEALVIDSEIARYVRRVVDGISIDEDDLGLAAFEEVGPGGHFLGTTYTLDHYWREMWIPELLDRSPFKHDEDPRPGGLRRRARLAAEEALRCWTPPELPPEMEGRLDAIIQA
jgi:trimethylamine--corrinoid protein Co-methyltransferase